MIGDGRSTSLKNHSIEVPAAGAAQTRRRKEIATERVGEYVL
jgi:hypothetical protein